MSKIFAQNGHRIAMIEEPFEISKYDVLFNSIPAELKSLSSYKKNVKEALRRHQKEKG